MLKLKAIYDLKSEVSGNDDDIGRPTVFVVDRSAAADSDNRVAEPELPSEYFLGGFQRMFAELGVEEQQGIRYIQDKATRAMEEKAGEAAAKATGQASKQKQRVPILVDALKNRIDADALRTTFLPFLPGADAHGVSEVAPSSGKGGTGGKGGNGGKGSQSSSGGKGGRGGPDKWQAPRFADSQTWR
jgi:hypothetical protein